MKAETKQVGKKRWYPCPKCGDQHPSTTTLLDVMASPGLTHWLAKNGTAKLNVLNEIVEKMNPPAISSEDWNAIKKLAEDRWKLKEDTAFWKSGKEAGADAADEGILADSWLEAHFNGVEISKESLGPKAREMVERTLEWEKQHEVKTLFTQKTFYNCKLNYAGTCDWGGMIDRELSILDWKRAGKVYFNHVIQVWSYALADESQHGDRLYGKVGVGSLGKDDPITFFKRNQFPSIETARDVLIACGHIFQAQQEWDTKFPWQKKEKPKPTEVVK